MVQPTHYHRRIRLGGDVRENQDRRPLGLQALATAGMSSPCRPHCEVTPATSRMNRPMSTSTGTTSRRSFDRVAGAESSKPRLAYQAGASKTQPRPHKRLLAEAGITP